MSVLSANKARSAAPPVIEHPDQIEDLREPWDGLEGAMTTPMQHRIWTQAAAETLIEKNSLRVVTCGTANHLTAIAPLVKKGGWQGNLEIVGLGELTEPSDFIYRDERALAELLDQVIKLGEALFIERVFTSSPLIEALRVAYRGRGFFRVTPALGCPYIDLHAGWVEPESQFNSGRRSDFRRAQRHAEKLGEVDFEIVSPTADQLEPMVEEAFGVEAASWKGEGGSALAIDHLRGNFYRNYALAARDRGILRLCFMRVGGRAIAMQYAVECQNRFWLLKIGYNQEFSRCSPGTLLMLQTLRYAAERGLASYEFLGTEAPWTQVWTSNLRECAKIQAYPARLRGLTSLAFDATRHMGHRFSKSSEEES
ncbi:MAG TPA: GNAT family N-acetyltransferase [Blastocatellia bacterium]|nr:GNAT family N-acetyltransferase [Blastocatellia bacterium]